MRSPEAFAKTIYLGDRACKSLAIDGWNRVVRITVDVISRIRSPSGEWEYYTAEDIEDGQLVFEGVRSVSVTFDGPLPNDWIDFTSVRPIGLPGAAGALSHEYALSVGCVDDDGNAQESTIKITAERLYLEDPRRPHQPITE
jgi:hypothetical protein